ncbi:MULTISPECIES: acyltransferase family protein [unclassified Agrococcus]|uniref:acyltransferase family protein n=1 Tax=unclassified Agrococcus TaxID=2615065 RepID=UPI00361B174B
MHRSSSLDATESRPRFARYPTATGPSIGEALAGRDNALGILRLLLAAAVVLSHSYPIGGWGQDPFAARFEQQENLGGVAVLGFFAISGYLIAKSGARTDVVQFLWHRVLRIMPAYWLVLLVAAFVIGPAWWLAKGRDLAAYLTAEPGGPVAYLLANWDLSIRQYGILDVFGDNPYGAVAGSVMNGSLWTLRYEFFAYLVIAGLVLFGVLVSARWIVPVVTGVLFALQMAYAIAGDAALGLLPFFTDRYFIQLTLIFMIGSCIAVYSRHVPLHDGLAALAAVVVVVSAFRGGLHVVGLPAFAYVLLYLAARLPRRLQWIGRDNDYSYGLYLYGWPMQQVLAALGVHLWGYVPFTLLALVAAFAMAWLSWHGVERWAMRLKDRGPGRGVAYWVERVRAARRTRMPADA